MTTIKDTMDLWLEAALAYVRDSLRTNSVVGLQANGGLRQIEIGEVDLVEVAKQPDGEPTAWITSPRDSPTRTGNVIEHRVSVEIHIYTSASLQDLAKLADAQEDFRKTSSRVWNEALELRDGGITARVWDDWYPEGDITRIPIAVEDSAVMTCVIPFEFLLDRIWISGGV